MLEVQLRLQRPSWDREGRQERAALGRRTWTRRRDTRQNTGGRVCTSGTAPAASGKGQARPSEEGGL